MAKYFFKAGEFAALCGVKKDTLFHYDHIGILKPERITENGYRYYSVKQFYTFDLITALKRLGMALADIKAYLDQRTPQTFLALLKEQQLTLSRERQRLESIDLLLRETIRMTELAEQVKPGEIRLEHCPTEYYVAVQAPDFLHYEEPQFLLRIRSLLEWSKEHGGLAFSPGDIVLKNNLLKGSFVEDYYYCKVPPGTQVEDVLEKPAGTYAVLYHQGEYETLETAYAYLVQWVESHKYTILGDLYEEDLLQFLSIEDPKQYKMRISVQVGDV